MAVVYPRQNLVVATNGGTVVLRDDQPWDDESDLVRERPDLFDAEPRKVRGRVERASGGPIEQATRAPGERRRRTRSTPRYRED